MIRFLSWFNPLKIRPTLDPKTNELSADHILHGLIAVNVNPSLVALAARYEEIDALPDPLLIVPHAPLILDKLVWPLRHAKCSYTVGNYIGCIALCGMVGEMVAILLWDISKVPLHGQSMSQSQQRAMFGNTFERLGQTRRVNVLHAQQIIDDATKAAFDSICRIRNKYLHFLSQAHDVIKEDARQAFANALKVVAAVLGQTLADGGIVLRPDLEAYLLDNGIIPRPEPEDGNP